MTKMEEIYKYWEEVSTLLENKVNELSIQEAEQYIAASLALFSFVTENIVSKITKNKGLEEHLFPLLVELHD